MTAATTPTSPSAPTIVGSWIGQDATEKRVLTFLNNGTYLLANREGSSAGVEYASYSWDSATGVLTSATLASAGGVGLPKIGTNLVQIQADGSLKLTVGQDGQVISFQPVLSTPGDIVGSWYSDAKDGGSDDVVVTFLADGTMVLANKGTVSRDPTGRTGAEYGSYTWNATTGEATYRIDTDTDGEWGFSHGGPRKLLVSGSQLSLVGIDGSTTAVGPPFIRVSNLQESGPVQRTGTAGADTLTGGSANDTLSGLAGDDTLDGGAGVDTAVFSGARASYTLARGAGTTTVTSSAEGTDTLVNIERLQFSDVSVALDLSGNAGTTARILGAVFGPEGLAIKQYVGIGLQLLDAGTSYEALMQAALAAKLGAGASHTAVVNLLYTNVIGTAPGPAELALYKGLLDSGAMTQGALGVLAADTSFNAANINLTGLADTGIEYLPQG